MKFSVLACAAICSGVASAFPLVPRQAVASAADIARLAPELGSFPNTNPNSGGDCDGPRQPDGKIPKVPCACPPLKDDFIKSLIANVQAGHAVNNTGVKISFPTGNTPQDKHGRLTAGTITLQNLRAAGVGCPNVATTFSQQSKNIDACGDNFCGGNAPAAAAPPPAAVTTAPPKAGGGNGGAQSTRTVTQVTTVTSTVTVTAGAAAQTNNAQKNVQPAPAAAPPANNGVLSRDLVDRLAPQLGASPNTNPNKSGDCDGPRQPDGKIPKVPCACPPNRSEFIDQLLANIQAGHAVRNPTVKLSFPTGNSKQDQRDRITAGTITLQNLNGPGKGCPNVSTTFAAQAAAIGN